MADLAARLEVTKLRRELGTDDDALSFLEQIPAVQLRGIRTMISDSMFTHHEARFVRIAGLTKILPMALTAKIASMAIGPMISAQIANVIEPKDAVKLARLLKPEFLADVSLHLDPGKVEPIIAGLPPATIVSVGSLLLARDEHITLGRFVSVVGVEESLSVVRDARARDLLLVALYTEDISSLDEIVAQLPDQRIREIIEAAIEGAQIDDALTVIGALSPTGRARLVEQSSFLDVDGREQMIAAVDRHDAWGMFLIVMDVLPADSLAALVNVPATLDAGVMERVIGAVRALDLAPMMAPILLALDDEHLEVARSVPVLHEAAMQKWIINHAGASKDLAKSFIQSLA